MTLGARLRQRLDALSSGRLKLAALAVLLVYAITIFCSVVVQVTMTIAAVAKDPVIVAAAELGEGAPGLRRDGLGGVGARDPRRARPARPLDRPHRRAGTRARRRRAARRFFPGKLPLARHAARCPLVLEVALACAPGTDVAMAQRAERSLAAALAVALPETQFSLVVQAVPRPPSRAAVTAVGVGGS